MTRRLGRLRDQRARLIGPAGAFVATLVVLAAGCGGSDEPSSSSSAPATISGAQVSTERGRAGLADPGEGFGEDGPERPRPAWPYSSPPPFPPEDCDEAVVWQEVSTSPRPNCLISNRASVVDLVASKEVVGQGDTLTLTLADVGQGFAIPTSGVGWERWTLYAFGQSAGVNPGWYPGNRPGLRGQPPYGADPLDRDGSWERVSGCAGRDRSCTWRLLRAPSGSAYTRVYLGVSLDGVMRGDRTWAYHETWIDVVQTEAPPPTTTTAATTSGAPVANIRFTQDPANLRVVTFDAGGSTDPDGDPLTYAWDFGDTGQESGPPAVVKHTYARRGSYPVTLTVSDGSGGSGRSSVTVGIHAAKGTMREQVCGEPGTAAPTFDGYIEALGKRRRVPGAKGPSEQQGEFVVIAPRGPLTITPVTATQDVRRRSPAWTPGQLAVDMTGEVSGLEFVRCHSRSAPTTANIRLRNKTYLSDTPAVQSGGTFRICNSDDFEYEPYGHVYGDSDSWTRGIVVGPAPSCVSLSAPENTTGRVIYYELFDRLHPLMWLVISILPR